MTLPHSLRSPSSNPSRLPIGPSPSPSPRPPANSPSRTNPPVLPLPLAHLRTPSSLTARTRPSDLLLLPRPTPSSPTFAPAPAPFFRPARPYYPSNASSGPRPPSALSSAAPTTSDARHSRAYTLGSDLDDAPSLRPSHEPLLTTPAPPPPSTTPPQAPFTRPAVRDSLERLFRRLSADDAALARRPVPLVLEKPGATDEELDEEEEEEGTLSPRTSAGSRPRARAGSHTKSLGAPSLSVPAAAAATATAATAPRPTPSPADTAPAPPPSRAALPRVDPTTHRPIRNHALHPSRNRFLLGGRVLVGGDAPTAFLGSLALVLAIAGAWFGTTCVWWWRELSPGVAVVGGYLCLLTVSTMLATALRDPGILPRNLDLDPPYPSAASGGSAGRAPLPRDLNVRAGVVRVKYCPTCKMYRPPRSSHCKMCDNCVEGCDHHCQWVNNCVGHRNYTSFIAFLVFAVLTLALVICTSAIHLYLLTVRERIGFGTALARGAGSAVAFVLAVLLVWPISALLAYHARLLLLNVTTIEQIRNSAQKALGAGQAPPNPFSHGSKRRNALVGLCRPEGASWLDARGWATEDGRAVNPGMKALAG